MNRPPPLVGRHKLPKCRRGVRPRLLAEPTQVDAEDGRVGQVRLIRDHLVGERRQALHVEIVLPVQVTVASDVVPRRGHEVLALVKPRHAVVGGAGERDDRLGDVDRERLGVGPAEHRPRQQSAVDVLARAVADGIPVAQRDRAELELERAVLRVTQAHEAEQLGQGVRLDVQDPVVVRPRMKTVRADGVVPEIILGGVCRRIVGPDGGGRRYGVQDVHRLLNGHHAVRPEVVQERLVVGVGDDRRVPAVLLAEVVHIHPVGAVGQGEGVRPGRPRKEEPHRPHRSF